MVVHDYLTQRGGAERVVLAIMRTFPGARLITSVYAPGQTYDEFLQYNVETLWPNKFGPIRRDPRLALTVLGSAFSRCRVTDADLVICSTSGWAHAVRTTAPKLVYCHNPARWLYQADDYFGHLPGVVKLVAFGALAYHRRRDRRWAGSADVYVANSQVVRQRVHAAYGREAEVIYPPGLSVGPQLAMEAIEPGYYLAVGRRRNYKNNAELIDIFASRPDDRLVVVGGGWGKKSEALPENVTVLEDLSDSEMRWLYSHTAALLAFANEDFGLTPVEAYQFGRPVVALRAGGYLETVIEGETGVFADLLDVASLAEAIDSVQGIEADGSAIARHALRFTENTFSTALLDIGAQLVSERESVPARGPSGTASTIESLRT